MNLPNPDGRKLGAHKWWSEMRGSLKLHMQIVLVSDRQDVHERADEAEENKDDIGLLL